MIWNDNAINIYTNGLCVREEGEGARVEKYNPIESILLWDGGGGRGIGYTAGLWEAPSNFADFLAFPSLTQLIEF